MIGDLRDRLDELLDGWAGRYLPHAAIPKLVDELMPLIEEELDRELREGAALGGTAVAFEFRKRYLEGGAALNMHEPDAMKTLRTDRPQQG